MRLADREKIEEVERKLDSVGSFEFRYPRGKKLVRVYSQAPKQGQYTYDVASQAYVFSNSDAKRSIVFMPVGWEDKPFSLKSNQAHMRLNKTSTVAIERLTVKLN